MSNANQPPKTFTYKKYTIESRARYNRRIYYIYRPGVFEAIPADRAPREQHSIASATTLQGARARVSADIPFQYERDRLVARMLGMDF